MSGALIAANAPMTVSQVALYQGADREKILIDGAKKEGAFTLYGSHTWYRTMAKEFEKKYPFIKVTEYRTDGRTPDQARHRGNQSRSVHRRCHRYHRRTDRRDETGRSFSRTLDTRRASLPGRRQNQRQERFLLRRPLRDLCQLGLQHVCRFRRPKRRKRWRDLLESEMERQDVDRQHDDGYALDRQHAGELWTGNTWRKSPSKRSKCKTWPARAGRPGSVRRSAAVADDLRRQHHPGQTKGRAGGLASAGAGGDHGRLFRPIGKSAASRMRLCSFSTGCIRKKASR